MDRFDIFRHYFKHVIDTLSEEEKKIISDDFYTMFEKVCGSLEKKFKSIEDFSESVSYAFVTPDYDMSALGFKLSKVDIEKDKYNGKYDVVEWWDNNTVTVTRFYELNTKSLEYTNDKNILIILRYLIDNAKLEDVTVKIIFDSLKEIANRIEACNMLEAHYVSIEEYENAQKYLDIKNFLSKI